MEKNVELTSEEKLKLETRGFLVKKGEGLFNLFLLFIYTLIIVSIFIGMLYFFVYLFTGVSSLRAKDLFLVIPFIMLGYFLGKSVIDGIKFLYYKILMGSVFFNKDGLIIFNKRYTSLDNVYELSIVSLLYERVISPIKIELPSKKIGAFDGRLTDYVFGLVIDASIIINLLIVLIYFILQYSSIFILISISIFCAFIAFYICIKVIYVKNPLYSFGNLGEKIQSLTPKISEQSKQIEGEFRGDMDFRVLSQAFDSLASTFSQIVNLVVKLEKVEQKANKGDLFDSTKYINSLREDIRTPLLSLKNFLESKKTELESSLEGLTRVRVIVGGEGENRELQSMRATELMKELDENIGKLDVMLEKI